MTFDVVQEEFVCAAVVAEKLPMGKATQTCLSRRVRRCAHMCLCRFEWRAWHCVTCEVFQEECVCTTVVRIKLPCGENHTNVSLSMCQKMCSCGFAWQALCDIRCVSGGICVRDRRGRKVAVSWGKPQKSVLMSFFFAWQAWHFVTFDVFKEEFVCATVVA